MRILIDIANFQFIQILVFGSLFLGIYYFTMYDDGSALRKTIADIQEKTQQVEEQVEKKQQKLEEVKTFEQEILSQEEAVKYFLNFIPSSLTFTDVSTLLINEAKSSGVNIEVKQDERIDEQDDSEYHTLNIQLTVNGAFSQILLFLSKLTEQKRILIVKDIGMKIDRHTQLIEANMSILAYRYRGSLENGGPGGNKSK